MHVCTSSVYIYTNGEVSRQEALMRMRVAKRLCVAARLHIACRGGGCVALAQRGSWGSSWRRTPPPRSTKTHARSRRRSASPSAGTSGPPHARTRARAFRRDSQESSLGLGDDPRPMARQAGRPLVRLTGPTSRPPDRRTTVRLPDPSPTRPPVRPTDRPFVRPTA